MIGIVWFLLGATLFHGMDHAWVAQAMTSLQLYPLIAPFVILAIALFFMWLIKPRGRLHPGE